jgi:hypothetical protein
MMLLAEVRLFTDLSRRWQAAGLPLSLSAALVLAGVVTSILLAAWLFRRWQRERDRLAANSPALLLASLATAHGLQYRHRQLLTRLAKHYALSHPAQLFVEPALWTAEKLGPAWDRSRPELDELQQQLFAA